MKCPISKEGELFQIFFDDSAVRYRCLCHNIIWVENKEGQIQIDLDITQKKREGF